MQAALLSDPQHRDADRKAALTNSSAAPDSGCEQPTVGRKVTGGMSEWVDRRERMITMLDFRQPIDYTVKLTCKDAITGAGPHHELATSTWGRHWSPACEVLNMESTEYGHFLLRVHFVTCLCMPRAGNTEDFANDEEAAAGQASEAAYGTDPVHVSQQAPQNATAC